MNTYRRTAVVAGVLFIVATAASLVSTSLLNPILDKADYLGRIAANENRVIAGALFLIVAAFTSASIAISLYPVLRRHVEGLSLGSVGLRIIEGVFYAASAASTLAMVRLSQGSAGTNSPALSLDQTSGALLLALRDRASVVGVLAFFVGAFLYYCVFYKSRLIPRWLSGWGIVAVMLGFIAAMLVLFQVIGNLSTIQIVCSVPIAVNEIVLAVWLIVKGFNPSALASGSVVER